VVRFAALILLGLFTIGGTPVRAASLWESLAGPVFVHADTRELPEAAVMSLAQDRAGFLWVGTQGGLARYDGYHFRSFLPNPSDPKALPDGYVRTILPDADGGLWMGSSSKEQFPDTIERAKSLSHEHHSSRVLSFPRICVCLCFDDR
jgi:hypothetical protein